MPARLMRINETNSIVYRTWCLYTLRNSLPRRRSSPPRVFLLNAVRLVCRPNSEFRQAIRHSTPL